MCHWVKSYRHANFHIIMMSRHYIESCLVYSQRRHDNNGISCFLQPACCSNQFAIFCNLQNCQCDCSMHGIGSLIWILELNNKIQNIFTLQICLSLVWWMKQNAHVSTMMPYMMTSSMPILLNFHQPIRRLDSSIQPIRALL